DIPQLGARRLRPDIHVVPRLDNRHGMNQRLLQFCDALVILVGHHKSRACRSADAHAEFCCIAQLLDSSNHVSHRPLSISTRLALSTAALRKPSNASTTLRSAASSSAMRASTSAAR